MVWFLPFWYRLTWVVPEKRPLNGCVLRCTGYGKQYILPQSFPCNILSVIKCSFYNVCSGLVWVTIQTRLSEHVSQCNYSVNTTCEDVFIDS